MGQGVGQGDAGIWQAEDKRWVSQQGRMQDRVRLLAGAVGYAAPASPSMRGSCRHQRPSAARAVLRCAGGPGMMEAATRGALDAGGQVGGIRISREAGTTVRTASYLPSDSSVFCRYLSSRKASGRRADACMRACMWELG